MCHGRRKARRGKREEKKGRYVEARDVSSPPTASGTLGHTWWFLLLALQYLDARCLRLLFRPRQVAAVTVASFRQSKHLLVDATWSWVKLLNFTLLNLWLSPPGQKEGLRAPVSGPNTTARLSILLVVTGRIVLSNISGCNERECEWVHEFTSKKRDSVQKLCNQPLQ